jgi:beta-D-galactosyl-(1->4)-L-rhamnose phosphorylase
VGDFRTWNTSNLRTECAYYPRKGKLVVINNSDAAQKTKVWDGDGKTRAVSLKAHGIAILEVGK